MTLGANTTNTVVLPTTLDFTPSDDLQMITEENVDAKHTEKSKTGQDLEEFLESHEVIEINKFTERKEWIEEKIKACILFIWSCDLRLLLTSFIPSSWRICHPYRSSQMLMCLLLSLKRCHLAYQRARNTTNG